MGNSAAAVSLETEFTERKKLQTVDNKMMHQKEEDYWFLRRLAFEYDPLNLPLCEDTMEIHYFGRIMERMEAVYDKLRPSEQDRVKRYEQALDRYKSDPHKPAFLEWYDFCKIKSECILGQQVPDDLRDALAFFRTALETAEREKSEKERRLYDYDEQFAFEIEALEEDIEAQSSSRKE